VWLLSEGNGVNRCFSDIVIPQVGVDVQLIFAIGVVDLIYSANISVCAYIRIRLRIILCSYLSLKTPCVGDAVYNVRVYPPCPTPLLWRGYALYVLENKDVWYSVYFI